MPPKRRRSRLMGSVLVNASGSRSTMLRRDSECSSTPGRFLKSTTPGREKEKFITAASSSNVPSSEASNATCSTDVPLNSEMLRELKRRVLVCLDNNAAAAEVARRLLAERPDFSKAAAVSDNVSRRSCAVGERRKSTGQHETAASTSRSPSSSSTPFEIVTECFEMFDRMLSNIAKKDAEIGRLQTELAAAERRCRTYEARLTHLQQGYTRLKDSTASPEDAQRGLSNGDGIWRHNATDSAETLSVTSQTTAGDVTVTAMSGADGNVSDVTSGQQRSPRKSRRSSVEMLSLPSIHDSQNAGYAAATAAGVAAAEKVIAPSLGNNGFNRKRSAPSEASAEPFGGSGVAYAKRLRLDAVVSSRCKVEPLEEEEVETKEVEMKMDAEAMIADKWKGRTDHDRQRKGKKKRGKLSSPPAPEEKMAAKFGPCLTTGLPYYFGDFDTMLDRRELEENKRLADIQIDTPGWRVSPTCGRTRAATLAAAVGAANGESVTSLAEAEMPEEGPGFEEWAALSDEPFEARHRRLEQAEQKRDRAELRAVRERQRMARLRLRQNYGWLGPDQLGAEAAPPGLKGFGKAAGAAAAEVAEVAPPGEGGGGPGDGAPASAASVGRRGLPESLLPGGLEEGGAKDCCIYYYPKDQVPVVAFGRLLTPRRKRSHGFSLPWLPRRGR